MHCQSAEPIGAGDHPIKNLWRNLKRFVNDEIKNHPLTLIINRHRFHTVSDDEGYFAFDITIKDSLPIGYQKAQICPKNYPCQTIRIAVIQDGQNAVISDFDDTIIISDLKRKSNLFKNLFLKNYKQRRAIPEIKAQILRSLPPHKPDTPAPLFILTGSPHQLNTPIQAFLHRHGYPKAILLTKQIHGKASDPLFDQFSYKRAHIQHLFDLFPRMRWRLFGDSGEQDQAIYTAFAKRYPKRIIAYTIRSVKTGKLTTLRSEP